MTKSAATAQNIPTMTATARLASRLRSASSVCVLTGAGMSAESGIPTFRDAGGLWEDEDPLTLASVEGFLANPSRVQSWYAERIRGVAQAQPHAGHIALAEIESMLDVTIVTQNVDGLHARAGSTNVLEIHGNITRHFCVECGDDTGPGLSALTESDSSPNRLITCGHCGGLIRPAVVWFGEVLPYDIFARGVEAVSSADVFLSIGTSSSVYPASTLVDVATSHGTYAVEINVAPSETSHCFDSRLTGPAGKILPDLLTELRASRSTRENVRLN